MRGDAEAALQALASFEDRRQSPLTCDELAILKVEALAAAGRLEEAQSQLRRLVGVTSGHVQELDRLAFTARLLALHELSNELYQRAVSVAPTSSVAWYNLATSERSLGRLGDAIRAAEQAMALDPDALNALLMRSELGVHSVQANHVEELQGRLFRATTGREKIFLGYALGKELHDIGCYREALSAFNIGAQARRSMLHYDVAADEAKMAAIAEAYPRLSAPRLHGDDGDRYVFIVGLPRSGTTLVERVLSGLPLVHTNGETDNFSRALLAASPETGGNIFDRCASADDSKVRAYYERWAVPPGHAGLVVEKLPMNYLYLGAIRRALPAAKIIVVRRNPIDSCFAMYRTLFGAAYPFSYQFDELSRYYAAFDRLMRHWIDRAELDLVEISYENLVAQPAEVGKFLANACGLTWRVDAVDLRANQTASLTASAAQIRGNIYETSVELWRKYMPGLEPLVQKLQECDVALGYPPSLPEKAATD